MTAPVIIHGPWELGTNLTATGSRVDASGGGGGITGSGTTDTVAKFTGSTAIGDSVIVDTSTLVTITLTGGTIISAAPAGVGINDGGDGVSVVSPNGFQGFAATPATGTNGESYLELDTFDTGTCAGGASCPSLIDLTTSRGVPGTPLPLQTSDWVGGQINFRGANDGGGYNWGAVIHAFAGENFTSSASGTSLRFGTKAIGEGGSGQPTTRVQIDSNVNILNAFLTVPTHTPSAANDTGVAGTITWDASFIYVCIATNTWKRVAIATWP